MNRKQNKGFTLVEVLIAITILGIIVTPLFHAFVTSARTNAKAKRVMDATTLAQNIMEELKVGSLEDLAIQFNGYPGDTVITIGDTSTTYEEEAQRYVYEENRLSVKEVVQQDAEPQGVFIGQPSGKYNFLMRNVPMDNSAYDMVIEVSENASGKQELANVYSMNQSDCGYYAQTENMDQRAAAEFQIRNAAYVYEGAVQKNVAEFMAMMQRTITITIEEDVVNVNYKYVIPTGYTAESDRIYSETTRIFEDLSGEIDLKAVYLYYYPHLSNKSDAEKIVISNEKNLDVDVFLVKMQRTESETEQIQIPTTIDLKESVPQNESSLIRIYSNLGDAEYNLWNIDEAQFFNSLSSKETVASLYDVKIEVYQHQSEESEAFLTEYLLGSYTGSFMDDSQIEK